LNTHIKHLRTHWQTALAQYRFDGAWLSAGNEHFDFQDDHGPRFKPNPYLAQWIDPEYLTPGSKLLLLQDQEPVLFLHTPNDYWHAPPPLPTELEGLLQVRTFNDSSDLRDACQRAVSSSMQMCHIGPDAVNNEAMGLPNPAALIDYLHFHRATKTTYELEAMRYASDIGAAGHLAAANAFQLGGTEFDVHMAFLTASSQSEIELPYGNIVAINEHASILHYQHQERALPPSTSSLLIDAGGTYRGYASDITRTYAGAGEEEFAALIDLMQQHQHALIQAIEPGLSFAALHQQMHQQLGEVLVRADLVTCSAEAAFVEGITERFCPHGLGHLLGLQVHDVGGHLANDQGQTAPPPENYPSLRFTRQLSEDQVLTIEPGLYFIPSLLDELRTTNAPINWTGVDSLKVCGGIRIEDNVRVLHNGVENLTREAFARQQT